MSSYTRQPQTKQRTEGKGVREGGWGWWKREEGGWGVGGRGGGRSCTKCVHIDDRQQLSAYSLVIASALDI